MEWHPLWIAMYCIITNLSKSFLFIKVWNVSGLNCLNGKDTLHQKKGLKNWKHKEMKLKRSDVDRDNDSRMWLCALVCAAQYTRSDIYERRLDWLSKGSVSLKLWLLTSLQSFRHLERGRELAPLKIITYLSCLISEAVIWGWNVVFFCGMYGTLWRSIAI